MPDDASIQASTQRRYQVTYDDLPLSCPTAEMRLWDAHPRVYLPIAETGRATCPYCSAEYYLKDYVPQPPTSSE